MWSLPSAVSYLKCIVILIMLMYCIVMKDLADVDACFLPSSLADCADGILVPDR